LPVAVSVVMPVRNGLPFLDHAIQSIVGQSFSDFEFVILDDGSSDGTWERLQWWSGQDKRIRLARSDRYLGPALSSLRVCLLATAPLLARQDADDVSLPGRLERQVDAFRAFPDAALVGTLFETMDADGRVVRPRDRGRLLRSSLFNPFPHGSVMMSRQVFLDCGGYNEECAFWEDQDLFIRMASCGRVLVLIDSFYQYRLHLTSGRCEVPADQFAEICARSTRSLANRYKIAQGKGEFERESQVDCQAIYTALIHHFWVGRRPGMLQKLWQYRLFPETPYAFCIWMFALLAELHPLYLRSCVSRWVWFRDRLVSRQICGFDALELSYPWGSRKAVGRTIPVGALLADGRFVDPGRRCGLATG
jgi:GT2 family glycosyltransferase